ncbi:hypothetical protein EG68_00814 [Paragonimus skrjabini miyazakii]|uniref:MATH domain-containing protein n=1 Tax=Paragonimus skrjabini miyazakii TaxID=59628 RepID=A0A8S9Z3U2_9TREM|nr:hypothetical protein EG68_00814 [Paragonimus skrjabini miyazakii]
MKPPVTTTSRTPSLQLYRILRVGDKHNSQVYTFIIPPQLTRGFLQTVQSKEFTYGGLSWIVRVEYYCDPLDAQARRGSFVVNYQKQPMGVSLQACGLSAGIKVHLEYVRFTVLHQEYHSRNFSREELGTTFTSVNSTLKVPRWIESGFLLKERYLFDDWSCLLEIEVRGSVTFFEEQLRVPRDAKEAARCNLLESTSFTYAGSDWSLVLDWKSSSDRTASTERDVRPCFYMQRHSKSKHWTRIRFKITLSWHESGVTNSSMIDQLVQPESGAITSPVRIGDRKWFSSGASPILTMKHRISILVEFVAAVQISRVDLIPTAPQGGKNCSRVSDPTGFYWIVMSDILGTFVKLRLFPDPENVIFQKKEDTEGAIAIHSAAIGVQLIPYDPAMNIVKSLSQFYAINVPLKARSSTDNRLDNNEISQDILLTLNVEKVCSAEFGYSRPTDNSITLRLEWLHICHVYHEESRGYGELMDLQRYQLSQDFQAQKLDLRRLTSCKKDANSGRRSSKQHSTDTLPVPTDDVTYQPGCEPFERNRSLSSASHISRSASNQTRHGSLYNTTVGSSGATPYMSENQNRRTPKIHTPPVLINGTPHNGTTDADGGAQLSTNSNWRRHSSCLEDVASGAQRTRRRLPSPPSSPLNARSKDGHLSVELYASGSFCSSPRLNVRGNSGLNDT